jgi:TatD DNase family protein
MWDNHVHVTAAEFESCWQSELLDAADVGVTNVVAVAENAPDALKLLDYHSQWQHQALSLHVCLGLHPWQANMAELDMMMDVLATHRATIVGVGEIGLDYMPKTLASNAEDTKRLQQHCFKTQLAFAQAHNLPVNVHSSSAGHYVLDFLAQGNVSRGVLHAFDGKVKYAEQAHRMGLKLSVPACIVRSPGIQKMVKRLPLDALLLETDSPALGPEKGGLNHIANVLQSAQAIATLHGVSVEHVQAVTSATAAELWLPV